MSKQNSKKAKVLLLITIVLAIVAIVYYQTNVQSKNCDYLENNFNENAYIEKISTDRLTKDLEFADSSKSRFNVEERSSFHGLNYFDVSACYRIAVEFIVDTSTSIFQMPTTTNRKPNYRIYGYLVFIIKDTACRLTAYQNMDIKDRPEYGGYLFVPFTDKTNGKESYGAGRYLDIGIPKENIFILDFNEAYNPYCAYFDRWSCPLVPFDNYLEVSIPAGEKKYKHKEKAEL